MKAISYAFDAIDISEAGYEWCVNCQEWHLPEEHTNA